MMWQCVRGEAPGMNDGIEHAREQVAVVSVYRSAFESASDFLATRHPQTRTIHRLLDRLLPEECDKEVDSRKARVLSMEGLAGRVDALRREIEALDEVVSERIGSLEQRLGAAETAVEATVRAHKARIHRNHDKRLQMRDLHDGTVESDTVQRVAGSLSQELDAVLGAGGRRSLDALVASADAALLEERWQGLRWTFDLIYRAWGIFCLYLCLAAVGVFPPLAERFGFHPKPHASSGGLSESLRSLAADGSASGGLKDPSVRTLAGQAPRPGDDLDSTPSTAVLSGQIRARIMRAAVAQPAAAIGRSSL